MKMIKVEDAVGTILSHDVTQIIPGEFKGRLFKKGHILEDHLGLQNLYLSSLSL